jgi:hypothetical protein
MASDKTQDVSDVNDGTVTQGNVSFWWRRPGEAATSSLQISRLLALSFIAAIELLSVNDRQLRRSSCLIDYEALEILPEFGDRDRSS